MVNIVTVHWQSPQWVDIQLRYLDQNMDVPWRVFASMNGIDANLWDRFHFAAELEGDHPTKLNALAQIVSSQSEPADRLVFLDGDAFPVRPVGSWFDSLLAHHPLAALRRDENLGDIQPHPAFCLTTVGFWNEIEGDWRAGYTWESAYGTTTDVGGRLLCSLRERDVAWRPILRTNTNNLHPVWYGVYEHRIYHHGAGFRPRVSRLDILRQPDVYASLDPTGPLTDGSAAPKRRIRSRSVRPTRRTMLRHPRRVLAETGAWLRRRPEALRDRRRNRRVRQDERQAARVFSLISDDHKFYLSLDRGADTAGAG